MNQLTDKGFRQNKLERFHINNIPGLEAVEKALYAAVSDSGGFTRKVCTNLIESGGKRIRPILVLCAAQSFGTLTKEAVKTAAAYELIHMASLVHDDIIDESAIRRNQPTLNAQSGNLISVLVGDYLFAKAFEILSTGKLIPSMNFAVEAISQMCDGEIIQANNRYNLEQTREDYFDRIYKKTGILIAACCQAGAIAGGANEDQIQALKDYGTNLGYAFQIMDDILDFVGDPVDLGKPVGNDLKEGNLTLPILKLIAQEEYAEGLKKLLDQREFTQERYQEVMRLLKDSYALDEAYEEAENCVKKAKEALKVVKDSPSKSILIEIVERVLKRKN